MATVEALQSKLKEAVKQYEGKLAALSAVNCALQKECDQLREELDEALQPKTEAELDALELKEEFARRLGEQQKTIDILKYTNQKLQAKVRDAAADNSSAAAQLSALQEKHTKQQQEVASLTAQVSNLEKSSRRMTHRIKELGNERDKYASQVELLRIQLTEAQQAGSAAEATAAARIQLVQQEQQEALFTAQQQLSDARAELQQQLQAAQNAAAAGNEQAAAAAAGREAVLTAALSEAQASVRFYQDQQAEMEERHMKATQRMQEQIRQLESEKQELLSSSGSADTTLLRQVQALAAQLSEAQATASEQEHMLLLKLRAAEQAAVQAAAAEQDAVSRATTAEAAAAAAKEAAYTSVQDSVMLKSRLESVQRHSKTLEAERNAAREGLAAAQAREQEARQELQQQRQALQEQVQDTVHKMQLNTDEKQALQHQVQELRQQLDVLQQQHQEAQRKLEVQQQTLELQQPSLADDGGNDTGSNGVPTAQQHQHMQQHRKQGLERSSSRHNSLNGLLQLMGLSETEETPVSGPVDDSPLARSGTQHTFAQQQQRHGSSGLGARQLSDSVLSDMQQLQRLVQQQQQELLAATKERDAAVEQLYQALRQSDAAVAAMQAAEKAKQQQMDLERRLEIAMEIIGERSLRVEELEADILDMKTIFHSQLEEAMSQFHAATSKQGSHQRLSDAGEDY